MKSADVRLVDNSNNKHTAVLQNRRANSDRRMKHNRTDIMHKTWKA